ncbi:hypothetical protein [Streptomyces alanosinicus]|uniref:PQQ-binding-like beta-propeller repeat protein n=1 Tax=Streptomyces alanosinicus TaxID=68171 RepID=A0A918YHR1_9ACTN|nr:hypothetical protein [Streptomyces alanosinicus]GHE04446.1 hypothetical protein GCM10010339_36020 [Streptomyces alanosinicus]
MNHRSGIRPRARGAVVGMSLALALLTGCGGGGGTADGDTAGGGTTAPDPAAEGAAKGPAYRGPALPGFTARPAWSLRGEGTSAPGVLDLGSTLLLAKDARGHYASSGGLTEGVLYSAEEDDPLTLEFRDVKTGAVRTSRKVRARTVEAVTWHHGAPAVAVTTSATSESDGLTEAKTTTTATLYGADGRELAKVPSYKRGTLLDGYRVAEADDTLRLTPVDGGPSRTVTCTGTAASCTYDAESGTADASVAHAPLISGDYYAGFLNASDYQTDPEQVTLSELATGKQVWSTAGAKIPPGVELDDKGHPKSEEIRILRIADGKVLVGWKAGVSLSSGGWIDAWYDLKSGALLTSYKGAQEVLFSPSGNLAARDVVKFEDFPGTAVWQTADGKRLWEQQDGEHALDPVRFTADGSVLYGVTDDGSATNTGIAVDTRTKKVLAKNLPEESIPSVDAATGYGYVGTGAGLFVFAPA